MHNDNIHWIDILNHIHLYMYFNCVSDATWAYGRGGKRGEGVEAGGEGWATDTAAENSWSLTDRPHGQGGRECVNRIRILMKYSEKAAVVPG